MRIQPIKHITYTSEKDERHEAEEKRIKLLLELLSKMKIPQSRIQFLKLKTTRSSTLEWLRDNLAVHNSCHKNYKRTTNLINLTLRTLSTP
jgi:hypothetical protein